ncbi:LuxR C-terminal-related transcriptional regulator [Methylorubrum podarium]|uniref:LuxR C-terminal-related transcriptional regulator n=1 Tax=Methylorubrum podarium TaxID=200476 RepID=UPI001EE17912|nr:LuxR C-terminal-related transcriptional regulator [Methylorubrum podarium]
MLDRYLASPEEPGELTCLTAREREVVQLVAEGNSSKGVSQVLGLMSKTWLTPLLELPSATSWTTSRSRAVRQVSSPGSSGLAR